MMTFSPRITWRRRATRIAKKTGKMTLCKRATQAVAINGDSTEGEQKTCLLNTQVVMMK